MFSASPGKAATASAGGSASLDDLGAEFESMCVPVCHVTAAALTPHPRRASAKLEFLRNKKAQEQQRAAEAKAAQDAADHRAALIAVFGGVKAMNEVIDKVYDDGWSYRCG